MANQGSDRRIEIALVVPDKLIVSLYLVWEIMILLSLSTKLMWKICASFFFGQGGKYVPFSKCANDNSFLLFSKKKKKILVGVSRLDFF